MRTNGSRWRRACGLLVALLLASCAEVPLVPSDAGLAGAFLPGPADQDSGNVVIQYSNQTPQPVRWKLAWRLPDSSEPNGAVVVTEPGQAGTLAVSGGVELISASAEPIFEDAAASKPARAWTADPLLAGGDFQPGDIVTFTLAAHADDEPALTTEVLPGG